MKSKYYYINLTDQERVDILHSLINKRNILIEQGRYTDLVDEVIAKISKASDGQVQGRIHRQWGCRKIKRSSRETHANYAKFIDTLPYASGKA